MSSSIKTYHAILGILRNLYDNEEEVQGWLDAEFGEFKGKTPRELVGEGRSSEVLRYLVLRFEKKKPGGKRK